MVAFLCYWQNNSSIIVCSMLIDGWVLEYLALEGVIASTPASYRALHGLNATHSVSDAVALLDVCDSCLGYCYCDNIA